jgi:hypothetical protein
VEFGEKVMKVKNSYNTKRELSVPNSGYLKLAHFVRQSHHLIIISGLKNSLLTPLFGLVYNQKQNRNRRDAHGEDYLIEILNTAFPNSLNDPPNYPPTRYIPNHSFNITDSAFPPLKIGNKVEIKSYVSISFYSLSEA